MQSVKQDKCYWIPHSLFLISSKGCPMWMSSFTNYMQKSLEIATNILLSFIYSDNYQNNIY